MSTEELLTEANPQTLNQEKFSVEKLSIWLNLGQKLKPLWENAPGDYPVLKTDAAEKIVENQTNPSRPKYYHGLMHMAMAIASGEKVVSLLDLSQMGVEIDAPEKEDLSRLVEILLWYHDLILETTQTDQTVEALSAQYLIDQINQQLGSEEQLVDEEIQAIRTAIIGTETEIEDQKIVQPKADRSLLAGIVAVADLGHFFFDDFNEYFGLILALGEELGKLTIEDIQSISSKPTSALKEYLLQQTSFLDQYQLPASLPKDLANHLEQLKQRKVAALVKRLNLIFKREVEV